MVFKIVKPKEYNTKALYFREKLTEVIENCMDYSLTIIEAPMGYGKTTVIMEYLKNSEAKVLWQRVEDDSINGFWNNFAEKFKEFGEDTYKSLKKLTCPDDSVARMEALKIIEKIDFLQPTVLVIDDYHIVNNPIVDDFIYFLIMNEIENFHIIITARFVEFDKLEELKLKGYVHHITKEYFEFTPKEIVKYYKACGISLKDIEAEKLYNFTEGWISALYLLMINFVAEGKFNVTKDIYKLIESAIYLPLSEKSKEFLISICIFSSFTYEQAVYMWQREDIEEILTEIINKNAFIKYHSKTKTYQVHNLFTNYLKEILKTKNIEKELFYRAGRWFLRLKDYNTAIHYFYLSGKFEEMLSTLEKSRASNIYFDNKDQMIKYFEECPENIRSKHHFAVLIYAITLFSFNEMELFGKTCSEFISNVQKDESLDDYSRNNLLGDFELLISFTKYNDINEMSVHHKKAEKLLKEPSIFLNIESNWTFGSPSVLYMFYRESGKLYENVKDIKEAQPVYQKLTNGHGNGSEYVMEAERYFNIGDFENAEITAHKALFKAQSNMEISIIICALFVQMRLTILKADFNSALNILEEMHNCVSMNKEYFSIHTVDICEAYVYSLINKIDRIPKWIMNGDFTSSRLYFPAIPMLKLVYGRAMLLDRQYLQLISKENEFIEAASIFPNLLAQVYTYIYLAAANKQIYKDNEAELNIKKALDIAMPDKLYMPFVENCDYIKPLLEKIKSQTSHKTEGRYYDEIVKILEIYKVHKKAVEQINNQCFTQNHIGLSDRETEIAQLVAEGLTNKEISDKLSISQNTIKTQLKSIFTKLGVNSRVLLKQKLNK